MRIRFIIGDKIFFKDDVRYHIGRELQIPKFTPCEVRNVNNSAITVFVEATGREETVRNIPSRMFKLGTNIELVKALYGN